MLESPFHIKLETEGCYFIKKETVARLLLTSEKADFLIILPGGIGDVFQKWAKVLYEYNTHIIFVYDCVIRFI